MITTASHAEIMCISERRDCDIKNERVKECVLKHSSRLGRLVSDVSDSCTEVDIVVPPKFKEIQQRWTQFITATGKENGGDLATAIRAVTKPLVDSLTAAEEEHEKFEADAGSSSASDYSDSETESTTSRGSDDDESSGEEEGEYDSDEGTPPKRQRDNPRR